MADISAMGVEEIMVPAQPLDIEAERKAFEHWMSDEGEWVGAIKRYSNGDYILAQTAYAWAVWQARASLNTPNPHRA